MRTHPLPVLIIALILACRLATPAGAELKYVEGLEDIHARATRHLADGDTEAAAQAGEAIFELEAWHQGDPLAVATVQAIAEELQAAGRDDLARRLHDELTAAGRSLVEVGGPSLPAARSWWQANPVFVSRADTWSSPFVPSQDLKRIVVGNQAGILKILDGSNRQLFFKGIDARMFAPLTEDHRSAIRAALGIQEASVPSVLDGLVRNYPQLPKRQALALMGALGSDPNQSADLARRLQRFLSQTMQSDPDVVNRRQAVLALALLGSVEHRTVDEVVAFYASSENRWETFPVQQFFEYHAQQIKAWPTLGGIRNRIQAIDVFYTPHILEYLS